LEGAKIRLQDLFSRVKGDEYLIISVELQDYTNELEEIFHQFNYLYLYVNQIHINYLKTQLIMI
jgi:hypothetical protein